MHSASELTRVFPAPAEGAVIAATYEIERPLGSGSMGMVLRARHLRLGHPVAIKYLLPACCNPDTIARFEQEARAAAHIQSDHVARVMDMGRFADGTPYMVMEYLDGENLEERLGRRGPLPVQEAVDFVVQACEAIAEAHARGIIHRDLKTSNLFVTRRPDGSERIKVLDFGIAKVTADDATAADLGLTRTFMMMGSPTYMSPEQLKSTRDVDERTDLWSLGVILHELLSASVPFDGNDFPELCARITKSDPPRLGRRDAPEGLQAVVLRCVQKQPERRYANVAELAIALARFGSRQAMDSAERSLRITRARLGKSRRRAQARPHRATKLAALAIAAGLVVAGAVRSCAHPAQPEAQDRPLSMARSPGP